MADFIRVENLVFEYIKNEDGQAFRAIDDISFTVEKGGFTAIIGQNGSGKSTLAKNINGLLVPTSGSVTVDGLDTSVPENIWDIRQRVAMVFQNPDNQIVSSIVEDDVAFGPENLGIDPREIRRRVDEALTGVEMYDYRKKRLICCPAARSSGSPSPAPSPWNRTASFSTSLPPCWIRGDAGRCFPSSET